jgi:alanine-glyoxylate transaminase/serine-glyoxylate transaminase/serine-pyruvate transaminase
MSDTPYPSFRLLLGPGPANVHPRVLHAMGVPVHGHLDPELVAAMNEIQQSLRRLFHTTNETTLAVSGTGSAGMETCLVNVVEPGDKVIVPIGGYFGGRLAEVARRVGAQVVELPYDHGQPIDPDRVIAALKQHPDTRVVAMVHAETSTGVRQPLEEIGAAVAQTDALLLADCVTSLGGMPVEVDAWHVDLAYSCTQKCVGMVSGLSPVTFSPKALSRIARRKQPVASFYLGIDVLGAFWDPRRVYHHTACSTMFYGLREALRIVFEEGLEARWQRHAAAAELLRSRLEARGGRLFAAPDHRLPMLTTVLPPPGVDAAAVRAALLGEHSIEIGTGLGPWKDKLWRIGLMGYNARRAVIDMLCGAFDACVGH